MTMAFFENVLLMLCIAIGILLVYRYVAWTTREKPDYDAMPGYGSVGDWDVLAEEGKVVLAVLPLRGQMEYEREYFTLTPEDARQLAEWMRIAAAPGKSLEVARQGFQRKALQ